MLVRYQSRHGRCVMTGPVSCSMPAHSTMWSLARHQPSGWRCSYVRACCYCSAVACRSRSPPRNTVQALSYHALFSLESMTDWFAYCGYVLHRRYSVPIPRSHRSCRKPVNGASSSVTCFYNAGNCSGANPGLNMGPVVAYHETSSALAESPSATLAVFCCCSCLCMLSSPSLSGPVLQASYVPTPCLC